MMTQKYIFASNFFQGLLELNSQHHLPQALMKRITALLEWSGMIQRDATQGLDVFQHFCCPETLLLYFLMVLLLSIYSNLSDPMVAYPQCQTKERKWKIEANVIAVFQGLCYCILFYSLPNCKQHPVIRVLQLRNLKLWKVN